MNKYELISALIVRMDEIADAHGVARCGLINNAVLQLGELRAMLIEQDKRLRELEEKIDGRNEE